MILLDPDAKPIVAHRGASGEYPENTLLAFEMGVAQGADALEFDVRVSTDGTPVVIHDPTVDRTTDGSGAVRELTVTALRELDAGSGQRIPLVEDVLQAFSGLPLIIEVKDAAAVIPLANVIKHHGAAKRVLLGSFDTAMLTPFDDLGFFRSASSRETAWFWLATRFRLSPTSRRFHGFTVPVRHKGLRVVDPAFMGAARRLGLPVHVWTVDDRSEADRLRSLGVAGIITNYPERMKRPRRS